MLVEIVVWAAVVPGLVTGLLLGVVVWRYRDSEEAPPGATPIALFAGLAAGWIGALGPPELFPADATQWPFWAGLVAALVGSSLSLTRTSLAKWLVPVVLSGVLATLLTHNLAKHAWSTTETVGHILLITTVIGALWAALAALGDRTSTPSLLGTCVALAVGGAGVLALASSVKLGQLSGSLGAALGAATIVAAVAGGRLEARRISPLVAVVAGSLWVLAFLLAELPLAALLLLPLCPVPVMLLVRKPGRRPLVAAFIAASLTLPLLGGAAAWTILTDPSQETTTQDDSSPNQDYDEDYGYD